MIKVNIDFIESFNNSTSSTHKENVSKEFTAVTEKSITNKTIASAGSHTIASCSYKMLLISSSGDIALTINEIAVGTGTKLLFEGDITSYSITNNGAESVDVKIWGINE